MMELLLIVCVTTLEDNVLVLDQIDQSILSLAVPSDDDRLVDLLVMIPSYNPECQITHVFMSLTSSNKCCSHCDALFS
jgi:hypothetical protein